MDRHNRISLGGIAAGVFIAWLLYYWRLMPLLIRAFARLILSTPPPPGPGTSAAL